jgi:hypothetical protein
MADLHGLVSRLGSLAFSGLGAAFLGHAVWSIGAGVKSRAWPRTSGTITVDDLERDRMLRFTTYRAEVAYRYTVEGKEYAANRVFFGDSVATSLSGPAARRIVKYPVGSKVTVFYDPARPSTAVLEPGASWQNWLELAFGLVFLVLGVLEVLHAT